MFFTYSQNNSGGSFVGPLYVIVEAKDAPEANLLAGLAGVYFGGVKKGRDCECCGDRWWSVGDHEGTAEPEINGLSIFEYLESLNAPDSYVRGDADSQHYAILYRDGRVETSNGKPIEKEG